MSSEKDNNEQEIKKQIIDYIVDDLSRMTIEEIRCVYKIIRKKLSNI
jgi:hypothetical protein